MIPRARCPYSCPLLSRRRKTSDSSPYPCHLKLFGLLELELLPFSPIKTLSTLDFPGLLEFFIRMTTSLLLFFYLLILQGPILKLPPPWSLSLIYQKHCIRELNLSHFQPSQVFESRSLEESWWGKRMKLPDSSTSTEADNALATFLCYCISHRPAKTVLRTLWAVFFELPYSGHGFESWHHH